MDRDAVMTVHPASLVAGDLPPAGRRAGADSGDPRLNAQTIATDATGTTGVWECTPGGWPVVERTDTEVAFVLSGRAVITDGATGTEHAVGAGDVVVLPVGWSGRWDVSETLRKVYSLRPGPAGG